MSTVSIVPDGARYVVTPKGLDAMRSEPSCECRPRPDGGYLVCPDCGTAWAATRPAATIDWKGRR